MCISELKVKRDQEICWTEQQTSMDIIVTFYLLPSIYSPKQEQVNLSNIQKGLLAF